METIKIFTTTLFIVLLVLLIIFGISFALVLKTITNTNPVLGLIVLYLGSFLIILYGYSLVCLKSTLEKKWNNNK